jgi:hypothetical protein
VNSEEAELVEHTMQAVLFGLPLDQKGWRELWTRLPVEAPHPLNADKVRELRYIAALVVAPIASSPPPARDAPHGPLRLLARALIARASARPGDLSSLMEQAEAYFALVPYLRKKREHAFEHILSLVKSSIDAVPPPGTVSSVAMFVALANQLAQAFGNTEWLAAAWALHDRAYALAPGAGRLVVMSNLITTAKLLAQRHPEAPEPWLRSARTFAASIRTQAELLKPSPAEARVLRELVWQAATSAVTVQLALAERRKNAPAEARLVWQELTRLQALAQENDDPDKIRRYAAFEAMAREQLGPDFAANGAAEPLSAEAAAKIADELTVGVLRDVDRALSLPPAERERALEEQVASLYAHLSDALASTTAAVGVNHHVGRLLLSLGAIASGRLSGVTFHAVRNCVLSVSERPLGFYGMGQEARASFELESTSFGLIRTLAALTDMVASDPPLSSRLRRTLRGKNSELLAAIALGVRVMMPEGYVLDELEDFARLLALLRVTSPDNQHPPATTVSVAERTASSPRARGAKEILSLDWVSDPGSEPSTGRLEGLVGATGRLNGVPHRIDSILGSGRQKVVFGLVNLETNEQRALAFFRETDREALAAYLRELADGTRPYEAAEVIARCDIVLKSNPEDETAAFNKAVALDHLGELASSQQWFDVACASNPSDVNNLLFNASALARLGDRQRATKLWADSRALDHTAFTAHFARFERDRLLLDETLRALLAEAPENADVRRLLS